MMRLTENNIKAVRELTADGMTYSWFVVMKSGWVSDSRNYINWENGRTTVKEYPLEWLPKAVQNFVKKHERQEEDQKHNTYKGMEFVHYVYKA